MLGPRVAGLISSLLSLLDTPSSYTGNAFKFLRVNETETAIEFASDNNGSDGVFDGGERLTNDGVLDGGQRL